MEFDIADLPPNYGIFHNFFFFLNEGFPKSWDMSSGDQKDASHLSTNTGTPKCGFLIPRAERCVTSEA